MTDEMKCSSTWQDRKCVKPMYRAQNGEVWDHAGGHMYATEAQAEALRTGNYDATEWLRSMRPVIREDA